MINKEIYAECVRAACWECGREFQPWVEDAAIWVAVNAEREYFADGIAVHPHFDDERFYCGCDEEEGWCAA